MLNNYEWYRRWWGGYYDIDKKTFKVERKWEITPSLHLSIRRNTSKFIPEYTVHYPGKNQKPRLRIRALTRSMSMEEEVRHILRVVTAKAFDDARNAKPIVCNAKTYVDHIIKSQCNEH